jgi:hypothetical protein
MAEMTLLSFRHISVVHEEYAVDRTGAKMFGVMELVLLKRCGSHIGLHDR